MKNKRKLQVPENPVKTPKIKETGIIQPFKKRPVSNDRCGINRDKNPCGDASEY